MFMPSNPPPDRARSVRACSMAACCIFASGSLGRLSRPVIRIVVPFAPGGGTDVVARTLAQEMARDLGANIVIENKPGRGPSSAPRR